MGASVAGSTGRADTVAGVGPRAGLRPRRSSTPTPAISSTPLEPHVAGQLVRGDVHQLVRARSPPGLTFTGVHARLGRPDRAGHAVQRGVGHLDRDRRRPRARPAPSFRPARRSTTGRRCHVSTPPGTSCTRRRRSTIGGSRPGDSDERLHHAEQPGSSHWHIAIADVNIGELRDAIPVDLHRSRRLGRVDRGAAHGGGRGAADPGQLRFGDVHRHDLQPGQSGLRRPLTPIDMVDESGNVIATAGPTTSNGYPRRSPTATCRARAATGSWAPTAGSSPSVRPSSTDRPGACTCSGRSSASCPRRTTAGTGSMPPTAGSSATATPSSTAPYPGSGSIPPVRACPNSLNAPIVGMVPSIDDNGYFMVASDGGVFAFGDAHFAGSCPGIGGCAGSAVAVMPDASGDGYWLVTSTGNVYTFGDAAYFGAPGHGTVTSAVATPDGLGYWILLADGQVFALRRRRQRRLAARRGLRRARTPRRPSSAHRTAPATGCRPPSGRSTTSGTRPTTAGWPARTSTGRSSPPRGSDQARLICP